MKDLKRAFGSPDPDFQDRVRQTLFQIEEKEETLVKKKMTFSMALALILCVCIITVSAFAGSTLLTEKPDVTQPPLSHSESSSPNGTGEPESPLPILSDIYWPEEAGNIFHWDEDCKNMSYPCTIMSFSSALEAGGQPCPLCFSEITGFVTQPTLTGDPTSVLVTPMPTPTPIPAEVTLIPFKTSEPDPVSDEEPVYVWSSPGDASYHFNLFCTEAKEGLARVTLAVAENRQQTQCSSCSTLTYSYYELISEVYLPENSKVFHTAYDCSAMYFPATVPTLVEALSQGAQACELCAVPFFLDPTADPLVNPMLTPTPMMTSIPLQTITPMPTVTPLLTPMPTPTPMPTEAAGITVDLSSIEVYLPENGDTFHAGVDCENLPASYYISYLDVALAAGSQPCPSCFPVSSTDELIALYLHSMVTSALTVTPMPLQTITPMPTVTPAPAAQSIPGAVYLSRSGDGYFHLTPLCDEADSASSLSLTDALNKGFIPCPVCCGNEAVYTINGGDAYHHPDKTCFFYLASSSTSLDVSLTEALLRGKLPCEECVLNREETEEVLYYYTPEDWFCHSDTACLNEGDSIALLASEKELIAMGKRACEACMEPFSYYYTAEGAYYHAVSDCAHADLLLNEKLPEDQLIALGKRNCPWCLGWYDYYYSAKDPCYHKTSGCEKFIGPEASIRPLSEVSLLEMGKIPCEACFGESAPALSENQVYSTPNGVYYHFSPYCTGMKNAESITIAAALERNQKPCPACRTYRTCWIGEDSNLFHMSETCSRLSSAQIQLFSALPDEYQPCGLCVRFLDLNSNQYHRFARCTEFGGEDKANAYILCSTDLPALLGSTPCELCASSSASAPTATPDPAPANAPDFTERDLLISEAFSDTTVFAWDSDAPVYHAVYNCSGYEYLHQMDLTDAAAKNLTPCPECMNTEDTVWYAQDGEYYHSYLHYAYLDLPDVIECAPIDALAAGKRPCGNCMLTETAKADATLGSVPPLWSTGNGEIYFYDYTDGHSMYFHTASSCEAHPMRAPVAISLETAARFELHPCPECSNLLEQVILAEPDDRFYHISDECGSFAVPEYLTRWDAKKLGLEPCPDCAYTDIDRGSPIPTVPPQPVMPPSDDQQALKQWLLNEGEQRYCLTDLGYYSD